MIKILICDDMVHIRDHFARVIEKQEDMQVVGMCSQGCDVLDAVKKNPPDVVLMDIQMENGEAGIEAARQVVEYDSQIKVLMLTIHEEDELIFKAYVSGAVGYVLKTDDDSQIVESIRELSRNDVFVKPYVAKKLVNEFSKMHKHQQSVMFLITIISKLTKSELEILKMLYDGAHRKEISDKRVVELTTINKQIASILNKLGYHSVRQMRTELKHLKIFEIFPL